MKSLQPAGSAVRMAIVLAVLVLVNFATRGLRFGFGLFLTPIANEFGWAYGEVAFALSLFALVSGLLQPAVGVLVDRWGGGVVMAGGAALMGAGLALTGYAQSLWQFYAALGIVAAVGVSGTSTVATGAVVNRWFPDRLGTVLGVTSAGVNLGQLLLGPLVALLIVAFGWRSTYLIIGLPLVVLLGPLAWLGTREPARGTGGGLLTAPRPLTFSGDAFRQGDFWRLAISLFGCGFLMQMIFIHLPKMILVQGGTEATTALAVGLMGGCAMIGTMALGALSDRYPRRTVLALIYLARIPLVAMVVFFPGIWTFVAFGVLFGLLGFGTVPLTSAISAETFGKGSYGRIYGFVYLSHQIGAFLGVYIGGLSFDLTGTFTAALVVGMIISLNSVLVTLGLPLRRLPLEQKVTTVSG